MKPPCINQKGAALVVTLIVLTALAVVAVTMITNTSLDRVAVTGSANIYRAQLAAEAGVNTAMAILSSSAGPNMTLSLNRTAADPEDWHLVYNTVSPSGTLLSSNSSLPNIAPLANRTHTFELTPDNSRTAPLYPITNEDGETTGAFSYVVIDNTAKQCLDRFPVITPRAYSTTLNEVPFITANLTTATGLSATSSSIASLPSVRSANLLFNQDLGISATWVDTRNFSPSIAPDGRPKLNLRRLKYYVDQLAIDQNAGNPKAQVVEALLGQTSTVNATNAWGGGGLSWLISPQNPRPYTLVEARQIAANLIDYIDADIHPTTDNVDNPNYFGTEGRLTSDGTVQGHPFISAIGFGVIITSSSSPAHLGKLNSTRTLSFLTFANPWGRSIENFHELYTVEFNDLKVNGVATGGNLGGDASSYFPRLFNPSNPLSRLSDGPLLLAANSGATYPSAPSSLNYRGDLDFQPDNRQPEGMTFSNLSFQIMNVRLRFTSTDGTSSIVQVLNRLSGISVPMDPPNYAVPATGAIRVFSPGVVRNGLFLNGDPRLNFQQAQWILGRLTDAGAASVLPPESVPTVNVFSGMNPTTGDGPQGVPQNQTWYSTNTENHFFVRSPQVLNSNPASTPFDPASNPNGQVAVESIGELGYLSTGRPWQTLRMVVDPENPAGSGDFSILDFIESGSFPTSVQQTTLNGATTNQTIVNGRINPNTALLPTAIGLFRGIPNPPLSAQEATDLATTFATSRDLTGYPFLRTGSVGALPEMATPGATTKFRREELIRRVANLLTTQSSDFTILSYGEAINPVNNRPLSSATMESHVRLSFTANGTAIPSITSRMIE